MTEQSPILPEIQGVNAADILGESDNAYPGRSCGCIGVDEFETKHSNNEPQEVGRSVQVSALFMIEPPCTERYARWCERSAAQLMGSLLLDFHGTTVCNM